MAHSVPMYSHVQRLCFAYSVLRGFIALKGSEIDCVSWMHSVTKCEQSQTHQDQC